MAKVTQNKRPETATTKIQCRLNKEIVGSRIGFTVS